MVTNLNTAGISFAGCSTTTVRWTVGETQSYSPNVKILLSTNGGTSWSYTLLSRTANDGVQVIQLPNIPTTNARIMIASVESVFFAVNSQSFRITSSSSSCPAPTENSEEPGEPEEPEVPEEIPPIETGGNLSTTSSRKFSVASLVICK